MGNSGSKGQAKLTKTEEYVIQKGANRPEQWEILELSRGRDRVKRYLESLQNTYANQDKLARNHLSEKPPNKAAAKADLRRKKYLLQLIDKTNPQLEQLTTLVWEIKHAQQQKSVIDALEAGTTALTAINTEMGGIEHVEAVMTANADAIADERAISNMLGESLSAEDTEEVDIEFEKLEKEAAEAEAKKLEAKRQEVIAKGKVLPAVPDSQPMPEVPKIEPQGERGTEEAVKTEDERQPMPAQ